MNPTKPTSEQPAIERMADAVTQLREEMIASNWAAGELLDTHEPPVKCKFCETEFWALALLMIATSAGCVEGYFSGDVAAIALTVQGVAYSMYRQLTKSRAAKAVATIPGELLQTEFDQGVDVEDVWVQVEANDRRLESIEKMLGEMNARLIGNPGQSPTLKDGAPSLNGQATGGQAVNAPDGP